MTSETFDMASRIHFRRHTHSIFSIILLHLFPVFLDVVLFS